MNKTITLSLSGLVLIVVIVFLNLNRSAAIPTITVQDQNIRNGQVVINSATAAAPSWLVVQTETNGAPGPVIGYTKINKGESRNITVKINTAKATPKLFAMIHEDTGEKNKFDFPENDMPLTHKNEMVQKVFSAQQ